MKIYNRRGVEITLDEYGKLFTSEYQRVERTEVGDDVVVSTVWLGVDHRWGDGPPLIFETMVFGGEHDEVQERYSTEEDARAGHQRWVKTVSA